jgi:hypothetical protein
MSSQQRKIPSSSSTNKRENTITSRINSAASSTALRPRPTLASTLRNTAISRSNASLKTENGSKTELDASISTINSTLTNSPLQRSTSNAYISSNTPSANNSSLLNKSQTSYELNSSSTSKLNNNVTTTTTNNTSSLLSKYFVEKSNNCNKNFNNSGICAAGDLVKNIEVYIYMFSLCFIIKSLITLKTEIFFLHSIKNESNLYFINYFNLYFINS